MNLIRAGWLVLLAAAPQLSYGQEPLGLSAVQRPFQSADESTTQAGKRFTFVCPASDGAGATVYGTDVYTADSAVCAAAIHAGVLKQREPGIVTVVMGSGAKLFPASSRNGVTTREYGPWDRSYTFALDGAPGLITWRTVWSGVPEDFAAPIAVECPATGTVGGKIWGTDVYTRDSVVCVAAVHAGAITAERGGVVVVTRASHSGEYLASARNGVASQQYGPFLDAFRVTRAGATVVQSPSTVPDTSAGSATDASSDTAAQPANVTSDSAPAAATDEDRAAVVSAQQGLEPAGAESLQVPTQGTQQPGKKHGVYTGSLVVNPTSVSASMNGSGHVTVSWTPVLGASWYGVAGYSTALWREVHAPATSVTYQGLAPGQYTFQVGAFFEGGGSTGADEWPSVTATVLTPEEVKEIMDAMMKAADARQEAWDKTINIGR